jgi:hypothetical protein
MRCAALIACALGLVVAGCGDGGRDRAGDQAARDAEVVKRRAYGATQETPACWFLGRPSAPARRSSREAPAAVVEHLAILRRRQTPVERRALARDRASERYLPYSAAEVFTGATRIVRAGRRRFIVTVARLDNRSFDASRNASFAHCTRRERAEIVRRTAGHPEVRARALRLLDADVAAYRRRPTQVAVAINSYPVAPRGTAENSTAIASEGVLERVAAIALVPDGVARVRVRAGYESQPRITRTVAVHDNIARFGTGRSAIVSTTWLRADGSVLRHINHPILTVELCDGVKDPDC